MTPSRLPRLLVGLTALSFFAITLGMWFTPGRAAHRLGLEAIRASGLAVVRADLGGLFAGTALLLGAAAWTGRRLWFLAAAAVLAAVVVGRSIGWITVGISGDVPEFAIEIGLIAILVAGARGSASSEVADRPLTTERPRVLRRTLQVSTVVVAILIVGAGAVAALSSTVQQRIFERAAQERTAVVNTSILADDALRIAICGSSAPLASAGRAKACVAVFAGEKFYLVDVGPESVENLQLWGIPLSSVGGVLLTHFHSDHIGDLGELNLQTWAGGRPAALPVYGGPGVEQVVEGFNAAYRLDQGYRTAHHTARVMPPETWPMVPHAVALSGEPTPAKDRTAVVFDDGALRITAIEVDHSPISPAYGYRFDYRGRSAVVTGDLKFHPPLVKAAEGVDVLVSEAIAVSMTRAIGRGARHAGRDRAAAIMHDIEDYHITPDQAARIANEAHARLLVFYHLLPSPDNFLSRRLFADGVERVRRGEWAIADDGSLYTLPLGSSEVRIGRVGE